MNTFNAPYPWMFHRDEVDLLEDEMEDLYERYHRTAVGEEESFEAAVLREQWETQEQSDQALSQRLGLDESEEDDDEEPTLCEHEHPFGDAQQEADRRLSSLLRVHPLYRQAKAWAALVRPSAKSAHERTRYGALDLFRIYANANLVPLKVFAALVQEAYGDDIGHTIAKEEYRLALTYLGRIQESLRLASLVYDTQTWMTMAQRDGCELRSRVQAQLEVLHRRPSSI